MIITLQEIERIRQLYGEAVATSRDDAAEEQTRCRALNDAVALRSELDAALVELARQREIDEARGAMFGNGLSRAATPEDAQLRELARPVDTSRPMMQSATVPLADLRLEYPFTTTDAAHTFGSYATPTSLYGAVIAGLLDESAILQAGPLMIPTQTGEPLTVPVLGTDASADYRAEGAAATQSTPVLGKTALTAYNLSGYVQATDEFLKDAPGAETFVGTLCGRALGQKLALELAVGDGTDHVNGLFHAAASGKTAVSATTFAADELLALRASVTGANRRRGVWVISDAAELILLQMKDGEGHYLLIPSIAAGVPDMLFGKPLHVEANGPAVAAGTKPIVFGNLTDGYCVRPVGGIEITRSDAASTEAFVSWLVTWRFQVRVDADLLVPGAVKALEMAA